MFCEKIASLGAYGKGWPILFKSYLVLDKNIYIDIALWHYKAFAFMSKLSTLLG